MKLNYLNENDPNVKAVLLTAKFTESQFEENKVEKLCWPGVPMEAFMPELTQPLSDYRTVSKYLCLGKDVLLGSSPFSLALIDLWIDLAHTNILETGTPVVLLMFGRSPANLELFNAADLALKKYLQYVDDLLAKTKYLTGDSMTLADILSASLVAVHFMFRLNQADREKFQNLTNWFTGIKDTELFVAVYGKIGLCKTPKVPKEKGKKEEKKQQPLEKKKKDLPKEKKGKDKKPKDKGDLKPKEKPAPKKKEEAKVLPEYEGVKQVLQNPEWGNVVTRFPPEPSGFLHIGHFKAVMLNYHHSKMYNGKMVLRFDDTNPSKEKQTFVDNIKSDLKRLNVHPCKVTYTSDYFSDIAEHMRKLLTEGKCYADNTPGDRMKEERDLGIESECRSKDPADSLAIFEKMLEGDESADGWCIRAKLNMQDPVKCLRDPVFFRMNRTPHHRTGDRYKAYPTYDFACPIVDSMEGITHAMRTNEYKDRDALYHWVLENLGIRKVTLFEFGRLNFKYCLMSKRKLLLLVDEGAAESWSDPRFPTVQGIERRGMTIEALKQFMLDLGASLRTILLEWDKIWAFNKNIIDPVSKRFNAIVADTASTLTLSNGPETVEGKSAVYHLRQPELGLKVKLFTKDLLVESADVDGLNVGDKFTLRDIGNAIIETIDKDGDNFKVTAKLVDDTDYKGTRKVMWVSANPNYHTNVNCYEYSHILTKESLKDEDEKEIEKHIDYNSKHCTKYICEKDLVTLKTGDFLLIERRGYFRVDKDRSLTETPDLIFVPDGKTKNISTLSNKVDAKKVAAAGSKEEKALKLKKQPLEETKELSKKQLAKLAKKEAKKAKKAEYKAQEEALKE